jgi:hypothetical protein
VSPEFAIVEMWVAALVVWYPRPMPSLNIRRVDDGPGCYAVWLGSWPVFLDGLEGLPHIGDRFEIDGQLWRVVEWTDRIICERVPS